MSSSFYHAFTTTVTLVALTDYRKCSYCTCICNMPGKKHSATEAYIQEHKKTPTLFRIQTQHLLPHTASPFPHRQSSRSAYHSGTNLAQNPKEAAAAAAMVSVYKYKSRLGTWWKRRRWDNAGGRQSLYPLE